MAVGDQRIQVRVVQGSILEMEVQVSVNAAKSRGIMGGGVAGVIKRAGGAEVDEEARRQAPIPVGSAVVTWGGRTKYQAIIHAPTMPEPAMRIDPQNVALATRAALALAEAKGFASVAMPGMGTGVGGVAHTDAAAMMIKEIRTFVPRALQTVVLVDVDPAMVQAWRERLAHHTGA